MFSKFLLAVLRISCPSVSVKPHLFTCFLFVSVSFCGFPLAWGLKGINPTPSPSHNINTIQESCLVNHTVFHIHQWSSLCHAHFPLSGPTQVYGLDSTCSSWRINCYHSSFLLMKASLFWNTYFWGKIFQFGQNYVLCVQEIWTGELQSRSFSTLPTASLFPPWARGECLRLGKPISHCKHSNYSEIAFKEF